MAGVQTKYITPYSHQVRNGSLDSTPINIIYFASKNLNAPFYINMNMVN